jgi:ABC-type sugar transport system substrate-binding protein
MSRTRCSLSILAFAAFFSTCGCGRFGASSEGRTLTIGVAFETLQTEFWVAGLKAIEGELARRGIRLLEAVADGDPYRQLEQVRSFITRDVDGIILVPRDAQTCQPMIQAANAAGIPIVLFNRPADPGKGRAVSVVADNMELAKATVQYMIAQAARAGERHQAMVVLGDLGDINAIGRRDGFDAAVKEAGQVIDVVARVPSEWNQEKAQAGVVNALQAHPEIGFIFTSSDFLLPSIVAALKSAGKYKKIGEPGHVILGGFDGDGTAYRMLVEGTLDATGVQDVYFEAAACVQAIIEARAGRSPGDVVRDPGFVIHQGNRLEMASRMWGAQVEE